MGEQSTPVMALGFEASGDVTKRRFIDFTGAQIDTAGAKAQGVARYPIFGTQLQRRRADQYRTRNNSPRYAE